MELSVIGAAGGVAAWSVVADRLERLAASPSPEQLGVGRKLGILLPEDVPAPVAAVILRAELREVLLEPRGRVGAIPEALGELEAELGVSTQARLITGTRDEVSAWFEARYMLKTAGGLRELQPRVGDIVAGGLSIGQRVISSISSTGRIYLKGVPTRSAWPNHLALVLRTEQAGYEDLAREIDAELRNAKTRHSPNLAQFAGLDAFRLETTAPAPEGIRELEALLESGEGRELKFQNLLERHPAMLASLVLGGWATYVIPQARLGSEFVTDFLVLGLNSVGPQWVTVEIESPRHQLLLTDGALSAPVRHALKQIDDWREWLTVNVAYAQMGRRSSGTGLGLAGITNQAPGLVVIGRGDLSSERDPARSRSTERDRIDIHSWDWLLAHAREMAAGGRRPSGFALDNARRLADLDGYDEG